MKSVNKIKEKKRKGVKKPKIKPKKEKVLMVAQEIKFARLLSGNEKKTRDRVLKSFKKWLLSCFARGHEFKEDDFIRVWKGLFYAVWMSDKPLVQEELCETIAGILDLFPQEQVKSAFLMTKAGFRVLATEWYGIDHHRMDKFMMLVRRYLRGALRVAARGGWRRATCRLLAEALSGDDGILALKTPLYARNAGSMLLHVVDCYLEEIAKVSEGNIPGSSVVELLRPICAYVAGGASLQLCVAARRLLTQLLRQSDAGLAYSERARAWNQMGCPLGGPEALELASDDEEDKEMNGDHQGDDEEDHNEKALDPRAGRVDVVLHSIPVPAAELAQLLRGLLATAGSKAHKRTKICLERFEQLAKDDYPLRVRDVRSADAAGASARGGAARAARALRALDTQLLARSDHLALRGLSRKHRKRLLARSRAGLSIVDHVARQDITSTNGDWAVEATEDPVKLKHDTRTDKKPSVHLDTPKKNGDWAVEATEDPVKLKHDTRTDKKPSVHLDTPKKNGDWAVEATEDPVKLKHDTRTDKKPSVHLDTPKKVKFVLKNNSMQGTIDYYKSVRQSPSIPFDSSKKPSKTNLKVSTPSPINPFFKKKLRKIN